MSRPTVLPSLKSGLVLVAVAAMVAFGLGRQQRISADLALDSTTQIAEAEQIITASIEQDALLDSLTMSAPDPGSVPTLASGWTPPKKHPVPAHHRRSHRRGGHNSPMSASLVHSAIRPEKQLPAPADARTATSGKPVAVFAVLRN